MKRLKREDFSVQSGEVILPGQKKLNPRSLYNLFLYFGILYILLQYVPNSVWDPEMQKITIVLGAIGIWRYSWWFNHYLRSEYYRNRVYPKLRKKADKYWEEKPFNKTVHFMMTTYLEDADTTRRVVKSICDEARTSGLPVKVWLGSSVTFDEELVSDYMQLYGHDLPITLTIIRQYGSGKRQAIGLVLRTMARHDIDDDDMVVFMDGDSILGPGVVQKCGSLFAIDPELQAVTTDEEVVCFGPQWIETWLKMRFAQRRVAMQSHSVSNKVLTLTGRMSVFRAFHLKNEQLIRLLEADFLEHWLWGRFLFLSGDDKSTWYYMLLNDAKLLYVPDVTAYTVEVIEGNGVERMIQNFRRWSGNMLRNGSRALSLGPKKIGFFIWMCVLDQRLCMWSMLVSPVLAFTTSLFIDIGYLLNYVIWIAFSRMGLSLFLYRYSDKIYFSFPLLLYINQLVNSVLKVYSVFRLSKQRWANRGDQSYGLGGAERIKNWIANYLTAFWVSGLVVAVIVYSGVLKTPTLLYFLSTVNL